MSSKLVWQAFETQGLSWPSKILLLALADTANEEGITSPSVRTLVTYTSLSERSVYYHLKKLKALGIIVGLDTTPAGTVTYCLTRLGDARLAGGGARDAGGGARDAGGGCDVTPQNTSNGRKPPESARPLLPSSSEVSSRRDTDTFGERGVLGEREPLPCTAPPRRTPSKQERAVAAEIITHMNTLAGTRFRPDGPGADFVIARLRDGYTRLELGRMATWIWHQWAKDQEFRARYFRPQTLYNRTKCEAYCGQLPHMEDRHGRLPHTEEGQ